jgi:hypothetical protein
VSFGEGEAVEFANAVVHGANGFVAVGTHYDHGLGNFGPRPPHEGRVWVSSDGRSWANVTPPATFANAVLDHVLRRIDGSFLAIGRVTDPDREVPEDLGPLAAWESADGLRWQSADSGLPAGSTVHDVERGPQGFLAALDTPGVGATQQFGGASELWLSADGMSWELVHASPVDEYLVDIGAGDQGFVAVGYHRTGDASEENFVIASSDGREWIQSPSPPTDASQVTPQGPDWFAIAPGDLSARTAPVWFSANGLEWSEIAAISLETIGSGPDSTCQEFVGRLKSAAGRLIVGAGFSFPCSEGGVVTYGRTLMSLDGMSWQALPFAEQDVIEQGTNRGSVVLAAADADGNLVLVGQSNGRASFWFGESP